MARVRRERGRSARTTSYLCEALTASLRSPRPVPTVEDGRPNDGDGLRPPPVLSPLACCRGSSGEVREAFSAYREGIT